MDRTITIDVTLEENEIIMAERRRKAEEIERERAKQAKLLKERKEDTIKKGTASCQYLQ
jgi:phage anti-repressor protein